MISFNCRKSWGWSSKSSEVISILYPNDKRCWLPREAITQVRPEYPQYTTFLERVHYVIKNVRALDCELVSEGNIHRLALRIDRIDHETVDDLRSFLGANFISLVVVPEGMAFMQLELHFSSDL